jgi:hypothetical protein
MNFACVTSFVRYLGATVVVALVVAVGAGAASADPAARAHDYLKQGSSATRPDDRAGIRGADSPFLTASAPKTTPVRPDDRAGIRGIGATGVTASASALAASTPSGFDWGDAGLGAAGALAVILVAGALLMVGVRHRVPASHA